MKDDGRYGFGHDFPDDDPRHASGRLDVTTFPTRVTLRETATRDAVLALPMQGGVCDVCHCPPSSEVAMLFDANDNPTVALCVDCAAVCIQVALRVKMGGLVLQWRTQAAIKAERIARDEAAKAQRRNRKETTNASE